MNIAKNMEAIFFAAIALISATTFANASAPAQRTQPVAVASAAVQAPMQVVTISAKRMTPAEKSATVQ